MTPELIGLFVQIPLVGIFVWFSLQLIATFLKAIDARDQQWRAWMETERHANNEALKNMAERFANEIRNLQQRIGELSSKIE